ncbi:MAG: hypothetical protein V8R75_04265 [Oscillospiraceae bacterium]
MTTPSQNEVLLEGTPLASPEWYHENHGTHFYRFFLQVPRLSPARRTSCQYYLAEPQASLIEAGIPVRIQGQMRSFNNRSGVGNRLVLTVYGQTIQPGSGESCNHIVLSGSLCKPPIFHRTLWAAASVI